MWLSGDVHRACGFPAAVPVSSMPQRPPIPDAFMSNGSLPVTTGAAVPLPHRVSCTTDPSYIHFDNDGHVDDLMAFLLLSAVRTFRLGAVTLIEGNCVLDAVVQTYQCLKSLLSMPWLLMGVNRSPLPHPFPVDWRQLSHRINRLPCLAMPTADTSRGLVCTVEEIVHQRPRAVSCDVVATGPLTNVATLVSTASAASRQISRLVLMGGALDVGGNVAVGAQSDGTAEWNFFADPVAADAVLRSAVHCIVVPLDATTAFPVTEPFVTALGRKKTLRAQIAFQLWHSVYTNYRYWMWDAIAALVAIDESLIEAVEECPLGVVTAGRQQGRVVRLSEGTPCRIVKRVNVQRTMDLMMRLLDVE